MPAPIQISPPLLASALETALRAAVQEIYRTGKFEDLTVRRVRGVVERERGLGEGWFKNGGMNGEGERGGEEEGAWDWRGWSKGVIEGEVEACAANADPSSLPASAKGTPVKGKRKAVRKLEEEGEEVAVVKGRKRRRKREEDKDDDVEEGEGEDLDGGEEEDASPQVKKRRRAASTLSPPSAKEAENETSQELSPPPVESKVNGAATDDKSESEMSVLIDEPPKQRGRPKVGKKSDLSAKQAKKDKPPSKKSKKTSTTAATEEQSRDPDQEEIKRLQGWLTKCGIRKMWWKELQPYETSKAKISHLKEMLAEAGMSGRYSIEKASQIREERELKADLEAVQEGARIWGKGKDEDEDEDDGGGGARPKRRVAKGLQGLDFLNDEDGEETD